MKKAFRKSLKRQSSLGTYLKSGLSSSSSKTDPTFGYPILWPALAIKYQFNYPKDWYKIEAHWLDQIESFQEQPIDCPGRDGQMNNAITRVSQCNESYQLCNSLPRSFIVPKDLKDVILIDTLSTIIKNHRVPIITYCCPIEYRRNFLIRCASASSDQHESRIIDTISKAVKPLKVFRLQDLAPSVEKIEKAFRKLHNACRKTNDKNDNQYNNDANFLSRSGKWLARVSQTLKITNQTAHALLTQASIMLIENEDREWNCVISSLIQLLLEPHRRTIDGFESLLSKEWVYLVGGQPVIDLSNHNQAQHTQQRPNILFDLFLDCTYQIFIQNKNEFEFTSDYLSYLSKSQCSRTLDDVTRASFTNGSYISDCKQTERSNLEAQTTDNLTHSTYKPADPFKREILSGEAMHTFDNGKMLMLNPDYMPDKDLPILKIYDHVANVKLWSAQYGDW